jgi:hypothetical protein
MDEVKLDRLQPGLPVSDVRGDNIGTLAHVYEQAPTHEVAAPEGAASAPMPPSEKIIEVKTGVFGLGKHLYVPSAVVETVTDDQVVLNRPRDEIESSEWSERPPSLTKLI